MLNKNPIKIAPSILSANFAILQEEIDKVSDADYLHIDVMDGHFVPNITFGPVVIKSIKTNLVKDVHLMIENPIDFIEEFVKSGANIMTIHYEACKNILETIDKIHSFGVKAGLSLNPDSRIENIIDFIPKIDMILIMTVNPGFGGQKFIPEVLDKIKRLREMYPEIDIEVDGGINEETAKIAKENGANVFVSGSYIFNSKSPSKNIEKLRDILS
jgi:ribulose-phosphate 3-epimerase